MAARKSNTRREKAPNKADRPQQRPAEKPDPAPSAGQQAPPETKPAPSNDQPPPGLDGERHAAAQRHSHQAEFLRKGLIPSLMATALRLDHSIETPAYKVYLDQMMAESGNPSDPIEVMLIEQLCMAHYRIAQLHACAGESKGSETMKILNSLAARMLGEFRRTALALNAYRNEHRKKRPAENLKLFKAAQ